MKTNEEVAESIVDKIIEDLSDRCGLSDEWYQIDDEIRGQIKDMWIRIATKEMKKGKSK